MVGPSATSRRCRPCIFVDTVPYPSILGYSVLTHEAIIDAEWVTRSGLFCWNASPTPPPNNCAKLTPIRTGAVSSRTWVTTLSEAGSSATLPTTSGAVISSGHCSRNPKISMTTPGSSFSLRRGHSRSFPLGQPVSPAFVSGLTQEVWGLNDLGRESMGALPHRVWIRHLESSCRARRTAEVPRLDWL